MVIDRGVKVTLFVVFMQTDDCIAVFSRLPRPTYPNQEPFGYMPRYGDVSMYKKMLSEWSLWNTAFEKSREDELVKRREQSAKRREANRIANKDGNYYPPKGLTSPSVTASSTVLRS
jgi:hypothetical protein